MVYDTGAASLLTGDPSLASKEITGLETISAVHPADHMWLIDHGQKSIQVGGLMVAEYRVITEDGQVRWLLSRGRTYHDYANQPRRSRGIIIDITETREGGDRYYLHGSSVPPETSLERAADLALVLKKTLDDSVRADVRAATDALLLVLGRALAQAHRQH
jgi:hypothetical protein